MFRRFFAEGAFNMAFVPMFSKKLEGGDDPAGFARDAFAGLAVVLIVFTLLAHALHAGAGAGHGRRLRRGRRFDWRWHSARIAFPYILFISLAALLSGVLNAPGRFVAAAAAPVLLNIILIARCCWPEPAGRRLAVDVPAAATLDAGPGHDPCLGRGRGGHRAAGAGLVGGRAGGHAACACAARA